MYNALHPNDPFGLMPNVAAAPQGPMYVPPAPPQMAMPVAAQAVPVMPQPQAMPQTADPLGNKAPLCRTSHGCPAHAPRGCPCSPGKRLYADFESRS